MPAPQRAPVAFFIFNRPELTARVFAAIARARPTRLLVVGDGPRSDHPQDDSLVREARAVIEVDWPCELVTCYSDVNLGCKHRIASGLQWIFRQTDTAIILEDDCLPDQSFFPYCEELLFRYRDDERVQMVSGCNVLYPKGGSSYDYYFSRCYHIWGWATWARAWRTYDIEMRGWPQLRGTDWLERHLHGAPQAEIIREIFDLTHAEKVDTWDFQWVFAGWSRNAVSVIPDVNLVTNIGYGDAATNERDANSQLANLPTSSVSFPLHHPPTVEVWEEADKAEWAFVYPDPKERNALPGRLLDIVRSRQIGWPLGARE